LMTCGSFSSSEAYRMRVHFACRQAKRLLSCGWPEPWRLAERCRAVLVEPFLYAVIAFELTVATSFEDYPDRSVYRPTTSIGRHAFLLFSSTSESHRTPLAVGSLLHGRSPETSELARGKVLKGYEDNRSRLRTRVSRFASRRTGHGGASRGPFGLDGGTIRVTRSRLLRLQGGPKPSP